MTHETCHVYIRLQYSSSLVSRVRLELPIFYKLDSKMSLLEATAAAFVFTILCSVAVSKYDTNMNSIDNSIEGSIDNSIGSILCQVELEFLGVFKCTSQGVLLKLGYCATYKEGEGIFISNCPYFQLEGHNVTNREAGYICLPDNISELNDYMCGPMNRKGLLCKECIDEFGPSVTSLGYKCSNCTDAWYGIPLYIAVELFPVTLFYLIILIFRIHLASAPMVLFILHCHLIMYILLLNFGRDDVIKQLLLQTEHSPILIVVLSLLGIWNLDFIRYIVPPFCVSSRLLPSHIELLRCTATFYPLFLIFSTCICIELHGRNFRLLVWFCRPLLRCFKRLQRKWDTQNDIIDVFASFFLLFYVKLLCLGSALFRFLPLKYTLNGVVQRKHADIDGNFSRSKFAYLALPLMFIFNVLPVLLLVLYPFKLFRRCLSKCRLDQLFVTTFVEKFHGCYRDGLDSGRDLRSFSGLYFLLVLSLNQIHHSFVRKLNKSPWLILAFVFLTFTLVIALVQPYKKKLFNVLDSLLLAHLTVACLLLSREYFPGDDTQIFAVILLPTALFGLLAVFKVIAKVRNGLLKPYKHCYSCKWFKQLFKHGDTVAIEKFRTLGNPTASVINITTYGTFSELIQ